MAMYKVSLENDKFDSPFQKEDKKHDEKLKRLETEWTKESLYISPDLTPLDSLKEQVTSFNGIRLESELKELFVISTFHKSVLDKILSQPDAQGVRLYLSASIKNGKKEFKPIVVAVNSYFEDIVSADNLSVQNLYCEEDSKCPPPDPASACPKASLMHKSKGPK